MGCDYDALDDQLIVDEQGRMADVEQLWALVHQLIEGGVFLLQNVNPDNLSFDQMQNIASFLDWSHQNVCPEARADIQERGVVLERPIDHCGEDTEPQDLIVIRAVLTKEKLN